MDKKILVVDDEQNIAGVLADFLESEGFRVFKIYDPVEAIPLLQRESIQVMFLDLQMPRLSGIELCRKIRQKNQLAWITAVTGNRALFEIAECREAGFDEYLTKPVDLDRILKIATDAFDRLVLWRGR